MAYKFIGKIKKIGYESISKNFCEFNADNKIKIGEQEYGVAYEENNNLQVVPQFNDIDNSIFNMLLSCQNEKFEIDYDQNGISKVTVLK